MEFNFLGHQPPMLLESFLHQLPIEFKFPRPSGVKFPIRSLALVKLRVRHVKCILSFREDETKVKIQMADLFLRKLDVYIRQLQVCMRISAINSPAACSRSLLWTQGMQTMEIVPNRRANSEIEHHIFAYTNAGLWFHICCLN